MGRLLNFFQAVLSSNPGRQGFSLIEKKQLFAMNLIQDLCHQFLSIYNRLQFSVCIKRLLKKYEKFGTLSIHDQILLNIFWQRPDQGTT